MHAVIALELRALDLCKITLFFCFTGIYKVDIFVANNFYKDFFHNIEHTEFPKRTVVRYKIALDSSAFFHLFC